MKMPFNLCKIAFKDCSVFYYGGFTVNSGEGEIPTDSIAFSE